MLLDQFLVAYSHFPHHPGKGVLYDRLLPFVRDTWQAPRLRTRFGVRFECDLNDKVPRLIYYTGFDRKDCRVLQHLVKAGSVVVDAGANVGYFALLFARWLRGAGVVHAFEPFPETAIRFERNLQLNPDLEPLVRLHRLGLSDFVGNVPMSVPDRENQGSNYLGGAGGKTVEVTTLDAFCERERLTKLDLVKVDVEGSEVALLRGAEESIHRFRPILVIEVNPSTLQRLGYGCRDLIEAIGRHCYRLCYASRFGLKPLERLPIYGEEPNIYAFPL